LTFLHRAIPKLSRAVVALQDELSCNIIDGLSCLSRGTLSGCRLRSSMRPIDCLLGLLGDSIRCGGRGLPGVIGPDSHLKIGDDQLKY
jgi:hypothetical protein